MCTLLQVHQLLSPGEHLNKHSGQYLTSAQALMGHYRGCRRIPSGRVMVCYRITSEFAANFLSRVHSPKLNSPTTQCIHLILWKGPNTVGKEDDDRGSEIRRVRMVHRSKSTGSCLSVLQFFSIKRWASRTEPAKSLLWARETFMIWLRSWSADMWKSLSRTVLRQKVHQTSGAISTTSDLPQGLFLQG
jgi:hypothetical protein